MKIACILLLTLAFNQANSTESLKSLGVVASTPLTNAICLPSPELNVQDRGEAAFNFMMSELARVHRELYALPYTYEYIKMNFMPEIEAQRLILAPHYPTRQATGTNHDLANTLFREWFDTYPIESTDYIAYVESFVASH